MKHPEWSVDADETGGRTILSGVFRLESPAAYDRVFAPVASALEEGRDTVLDLRAVSLMNSSGIRGLADLVLAARRGRGGLTFVARSDIPWQSKTMASLQPLYDELVVELSTDDENP